MKIVFAIKSLASAVGGAERVLCMVCSELAIRGHEVFIVTFDRPGGAPFYSLDSRVKRVDMSVGKASQAARLFETVTRAYALRRFAQVEKPDVVVGFMHSMFIPLAFSLIGTGIPVLGSEHIVTEHYRTRRFQYLLLILAAPFLDRLTVLSEAIRLRYPNGVSRRMVVMPNPVVQKSNCINRDAAKSSMTLLSVGRFDQQKDHATLIRAFSRIERDFPEWSLKIIGEGVLRVSLEALIKELSLNDRVVMPGTTLNIGAEYEAADAFVMPSRYEAFGLATAEAMSHGLPVIGFADCSGTNELITPGRTGILVEPGCDRVGALAAGLASLMMDHSLRKRLGSAGCQEVKNKFSIRQVGDLWEDLLRTSSRVV